MKKLLVLLLKIFVVCLILFGSCYYALNSIMTSFVDKTQEVLVPDLQGKTLIDCLDILSQSKLALIKEGSEYNQNIPAGVVIRQTPPSGINVKEGKIIKITISQGGEMVYVPDLMGKTIRTANIELKAVGLMIGELTKKSSLKFEEGVILGQDPVAESAIEKDTAVKLLVSNGAPTDGTNLMPDWVGKNAKEAKQWAKEENFEVELLEEHTNLANEGEIFKQTPNYDEVITDQTKIVFYVADDTSKLELRNKTFEYIIPEGTQTTRVKFVLIDDLGQKDIFNAVRPAGSKISIPIKVSGKAIVKVFFNNISIEEVQIDE